MNSKYLATLLMMFGLLFTLAQCGRLATRISDDDSSSDSSDSDNDPEQETRAVLDFLQNDDDANEFLDQSRRLFSGTKSHMKDAKEAYEEKCERLLQARYCPDLTTWPAWNQAYNAATRK